MSIEIGSSLSGFELDGIVPQNARLPLVHGTSGKNGQSILNARKITKRHCKVFDKELVYLFYGRPAYVPNLGAESSAQSSFMPFFFVLDPEKVKTDIAYPFDSGAFVNGFYGEMIAEEFQVNDFKIPNDVDTLRMFVTRFFQSNENYYVREFDAHPTVKRANLIEDCYRNLVCSNHQTSVDDRSATIELQTSDSIDIKPDNVVAVVLSSIYRGSRIEKIIRETLDADTVYYRVRHGNPKEFVAAAKERVFDYLQDKGYF